MQNKQKIEDPKILGRQIESMGALKKEVLQINYNSKTITGLWMIAKTGVSAMAVVNDVGKLVATLSASDLRGTCSTNDISADQ